MEQNLDAALEAAKRKQQQRERQHKNRIYRLWLYLIAHPLILIFLVVFLLHVSAFTIFYEEITEAVGLKEDWKIIPVQFDDPNPVVESREDSADNLDQPKEQPKKVERQDDPVPQPEPDQIQTDTPPNRQATPDPVQPDWQRYEQMARVARFAGEGAFRGDNGLGNGSTIGGIGGDGMGGTSAAPPPPPPIPVKQPETIPDPVPQQVVKVEQTQPYRLPDVPQERFINYRDIDEEVRLQERNSINAFLEYPEQARRAGLMGEVVMDITVGKEGTVRAVNIVRGSGHGMDQAAMDAIKQVEFEPYRIDDDRVGIQNYPYKVTFELKE
jgi:TonB family protein